ncbi:MAG: class I SAM-dependent methyltransferase [Bacteroidia bacterium]
MDKSTQAAAIFDKLADLYAQKFMDVSLYHDSFNLFCAWVKQTDASVLELACGPGNITNYLLQQRPDFKILGIDLAPKMIALAQENNPSAQFQVMDCRTIDQLSQTFDAVMCGFCLPYLSKEEAIKLIADSALRLNAAGVIYISTMEDAYSKSGWKKGSTGDDIYMHFHEAAYLKDALNENGFVDIETTRIVSTASDGAEVVDLILMGRKK